MSNDEFHLDVQSRSDIDRLGTKGKNVAILVAFSKFGLGHVARCAKLAIRLKKSGWTPVVVSSQGEYFNLRAEFSFSTITLPEYRYGSYDIPRGIPKEGVVGSIPGLTLEQFQDLRSSLFKSVVQRLSPQLVYVDSYPFHPDKAESECGELFDYLVAEQPNVLRLSGFRGELSRPLDAETDGRIVALLKRNIHRLFVFVDPADKPILEERYGFLKRYLAAEYVGYVTPPRTSHICAAKSRRIDWLATVGGGIDGYSKLQLVCKTHRILESNGLSKRLLVVAGQRMPPHLYAALCSEFGRFDLIEIERMRSDIVEMMQQAELVFAMAGYNTCTELLLSTARIILMPRLTDDNDEQWIRANRFLNMHLVDSVVDTSTYDPESFAAEVLRVSRGRQAPRSHVCCTGAEAFAAIIANTLFPDARLSTNSCMPSMELRTSGAS